ncbi:MAG TPA: hypothetical protein VKB53_00450 [Gammaproteobacteria bacterium]|nr:hypothetical protein [Gammaproteobacteria bacterium]
MSAAELIRDIHRHGGDVTVDGDDLNLTATQPLSPDLLHQLRTQKVDLLAYLNAEADNTKAEPASACPDCGSGQYWQLPYQPWRCWWCMPNKPLTATTLTLPCHKAPAPPAGAQDVPDTLFETVCEGLSITRRTLRAELIDDDLSELTAPGLRQVAETLAAAPNQYEREASARLAQHPELTHAFVTTDDDDPEFVPVVVAIRDTATCELRIPRQQYAGLAMLEWIDQHLSGGAEMRIQQQAMWILLLLHVSMGSPDCSLSRAS